MNERIQGQTACGPQGLRAKPRLGAAAAAPMAPRSPIPPIGEVPPFARNGGHTAGPVASGSGLLRSTLKAGGVAAAILAAFYLPAEYGVDPTGIGGLLGLTEMGQIKQQLYAEADSEDAAAAAAAIPAAMPADVAARLDGIDARIAAIAAVVGADIAPVAVPAASAVPETAPVPQAVLSPEAVVTPTPVPEAAAVPVAPAPPESPAASEWRDEATATLAPSEAIEIKLAMEEGETATFAWSANGGALNYTTHGDGGGEITYENGRAVPGQEGTLTAAFTGKHGWFWRNRTDAPVTLTLQTGGEYAEMIRP